MDDCSCRCAADANAFTNVDYMKYSAIRRASAQLEGARGDERK